MKKRNMKARLTKAEKAQALKECREYDSKEAPTEAEKNNNDLNWLYLTGDHRARLRATLRHIAGLPLTESLCRDTLDEKDYSIQEYIKRYDDREIDNMLRCIDGAQDALTWLYGLFRREQADRTAGGDNVITFPKWGREAKT